MGGLVTGAALGAAFDLLFISVVDATQKLARFDSALNRLKLTLCFIKPVIDDIDSSNKILDRPQHETQAFTDQLIEGEKLVHKCSKINVAALHFQESKRISVVVSKLEEKMNEIVTTLKMNEIDDKDMLAHEEILC